ncbi:hypothetical protein BUALT_Bualt03G0224000 [Buddleja alternifolia]|uniref:RRP15-like protein n=1 Tax=Buddleja alternifolia TaxID=168488 RepID=A0AAV6Y3Z1_9LAMI|nr:hypothetical protein BUALT_Bualt03G0224000 [Buddleja alternifolia]
MARQIWSFLDLPWDIVARWHDSVETWLRCVAHWLDSSDYHLFLVLSWSIWSARNKVVWDNDRIEPRSIVSQAKAFLGAFRNAQAKVYGDISDHEHAEAIAAREAMKLGIRHVKRSNRVAHTLARSTVSSHEGSVDPLTSIIQFLVSDSDMAKFVRKKLGLMAEVMQSVDIKDGGRKRKVGKKKGKMAKKKQRLMAQSAANPKVKVDKRMKKLFEKRARDYNSDDDDDEGEDEGFDDSAPETRINHKYKKNYDRFEGELSDDGEESEAEEVSEDEDEDGGVQPGITKFTEGIRAFKVAFKKIVKKSGDDDDVLGPVLSAHKKLLAEKLADEEAEKKVRGEVKKEKHLKGEKGHVKPVNYLDAHEKFLLGVATKGVVKLFNAVNKAQNAQKGLNPLRSKDEKVIKKLRKEAFFSELGRTPSQSAGTVVGATSGSVDGEAPGWAPLRDNYMLTNPKLKDWDKMQDTSVADDFGRQSDADSSSDDD